MPERFDLLKLDYFYVQPELDIKKSGLAYAPVCEVNVGDIVDVGFARGFVVDKVNFCDRDEKFISMITDLIPIPRVIYKLKSMKYDNDLD